MDSCKVAFFTLNTDDASYGNPGMAGMGLVLRNAEGRFIAATTLKLPKSTAFMVEVSIIRMGLLLALNEGATKVQLQVDARIYRVANTVADILSKFGALSNLDSRWTDSPLDIIKPPLDGDFLGRTTPR
ncbi:hypothetical protein FRX31_016974, partial [Thalictrum thalictroides]